MPKIMFRPNPVPPPFPPPTPVGIILYAKPENFDGDTGLYVKFSVKPNIDFDVCIIRIDENELGTVSFADYSTTVFHFLNVENSGSLPFEGTIEFYSNDEEVLNLPLSAIYQED